MAPTSPATVARPGSGPGANGAPPHLLVVVLENHEASDVMSHMPYLASLVARGGLATQSFARTHPSLPNYLELLAGQTFGITSDCTDCTATGPSLASQMDGAGIAWTAYMEGIASPCPTAASTGAGYAKKHNPFAYFPALMARDCARVVPSDRLMADLSGPAPPEFAWLTPNLCHDAHDCSLATADDYLRTTIGPVLDSAWYRAGGAVIITFDEGTSDAGCCQIARGGHIVTVVVSPATAPGSQLTTPVDHAGTLGTIEDLYGLPRLGDAACPCAGGLLPLLGRHP